MLISWSFLDDWTDRQQILSECLSNIGKLVFLQLIKTWDYILDKGFLIQDFAEILQSSHGGGTHLTLSILQELTEISCEMFLWVFDSNAIAYFHNFVCDKISDSPWFINCEFFDVWDQVLVNLIHRQCFGEQNDAVDSLHSNWVLFVLVKVCKNLEEVVFWNLWNKFDHIL